MYGHEHRIIMLTAETLTAISARMIVVAPMQVILSTHGCDSAGSTEQRQGATFSI